uniref:Uncharacterized protein n=1 Tax=Ditylenchus dipsaci TaxID=166011 RepID=A0A915CZS2_9BILA
MAEILLQSLMSKLHPTLAESTRLSVSYTKTTLPAETFYHIYAAVPTTGVKGLYLVNKISTILGPRAEELKNMTELEFRTIMATPGPLIKKLLRAQQVDADTGSSVTVLITRQLDRKDMANLFNDDRWDKLTVVTKNILKKESRIF